ncbi:MAG: hypothetical protein ACOYEV_05515 [Candidatus Nanopelagicales bacterium]
MNHVPDELLAAVDATRETPVLSQPQVSDPRTADVYDVLDDLTQLIEHARAVPMSEKCVVSRNDCLDLLDAIRARLPRAVQEAEELLADRVQVVEEGYDQAHNLVLEAQSQAHDTLNEARDQSAQLVAAGQAEHARLVDHHQVTVTAVAEAEALRAQVWAEADAVREQARVDTEAMRAEVDEYIEAKFTSFEQTLDKTLAAVVKARQRMNERFGEPLVRQR